MRNKICFLLLFWIVFDSCKEDALTAFEDTRNSVYFYLDDKSEIREIMYSFTLTYDKEVTLNVPVKCSGLASGEVRKFCVAVVEDSTTAVQDKHFVIEKEVLFPAGAYDAFLPVRLINTDTALSSKTLVLTLELKPCADFELGDKDRRIVTIRFSNRLERPDGWADWMFGTYSRVKHKRFIQLAGQQFPTTEVLNSNFNYWYYGIGQALNNYYKENYPEKDENNQVIEPW